MSGASAPLIPITLSDDERLATLQLIRSENIGPATYRELISHFGSATSALIGLPDIIARSRPGRPIRLASNSAAEREMEQLRRVGGQMVFLGETRYPSALAAADSAPPVLSVRGSAKVLSRQIFAIVGSRNASLSGIKLTGQIAHQIGQAGFAVASGLARGIDSAAHEASLKSGTIAGFAGGVDQVYPKENQRLADAIIEAGGALISEMPFGWKPRAQDFPRRNRIVAGVSLGLLVVEAARRSGSLISARLANEMGRQVFAVPGSPLEPRSEGANQLILQGAQLTTSCDDILQALRPVVARSDVPSQTSYQSARPASDYAEPQDDDRKRLLEALGYSPISVDELIRFTGLRSADVQAILLELDLAGRIERRAGNKVSLT